MADSRETNCCASASCPRAVASLAAARETVPRLAGCCPSADVRFWDLGPNAGVHLFSDSDQTVLEGKKSDLPFERRLWSDHVEDDERVTTFFYHAPVPIVRERLDLKGYTVATAVSAVSLCLELAATFYDSWRWHFEGLAGATGEDWFACLQWIKDNEHLDENVRAKLEGLAGEVVACTASRAWECSEQGNAQSLVRRPWRSARAPAARLR